MYGGCKPYPLQLESPNFHCSNLLTNDIFIEGTAAYSERLYKKLIKILLISSAIVAEPIFCPLSAVSDLFEGYHPSFD